MEEVEELLVIYSRKCLSLLLLLLLFMIIEKYAKKEERKQLDYKLINKFKYNKNIIMDIYPRKD